MTITAFTGPLITCRDDPSGQVAGTNPDAGPSFFNHGYGLLDIRTPYTYYPGNDSGPVGGATAAGPRCWGHAAARFEIINQVPSAIADNNIAALQTPGAAVRTITLVSASGAGITVGTTITSAATNLSVTGLLAIDSAQSTVQFGQSGYVAAWNPATAVSRNLRITSGGNDSGITFTASGYDIYGYPMTETITGANAGIAAGIKAWKYISGITCSGDVATTVKVGTGDVYGLPIRADYFGSTEIFWNSVAITAATGFVAAVTTSPATATTGDVRGTYAVQSASDAAKRLQIFVTIPVANLTTQTGIYGVVQA